MKIEITLHYTFSSLVEPTVQEAIDNLPQWVDKIKDGKVYWKAHDNQQMAEFLAALIEIGIQD